MVGPLKEDRVTRGWLKENHGWLREDHGTRSLLQEDREQYALAEIDVCRSLLVETCIHMSYVACNVLLMEGLSMVKRKQLLYTVGRTERFHIVIKDGMHLWRTVSFS